jgi:GTP-binding protein
MRERAAGLWTDDDGFEVDPAIREGALGDHSAADAAGEGDEEE